MALRHCRRGGGARWSGSIVARWFAACCGMLLAPYASAQGADLVFKDSLENALPAAPVNLQANAISATRVDLTWSAAAQPAGVVVGGYRIRRNGMQIGTAGASATAYGDASAQPATSYSYTVRAYDATLPSNESADSAPAPATTPADPGGAIGLDARPSNTTCLSFDPPPGSTANLILTRVFPNLPAFSEPLGLLQAPGNGSRWYVVQHRGLVRVFANNAGVSTSSVFVDWSGRIPPQTDPQDESGLLGMAFDPNYGIGPGKNRYVYLSYTAPRAGEVRMFSTVSRLTASSDLATLDPASELVLFRIERETEYHNGGHLSFGPDGFLYAGFGDGGNDQVSQDDRTLMGKLVRIDVHRTTGSVPYAIPNDNPHAGNPPCNASGAGAAACPEIYAKGFRNPWRWNFDRVSGTLWLGDVGESQQEEIDIVVRGGNYAWPIKEGNLCRSTAAQCNRADLIGPVAALPHGEAGSITGGFVYRGTQITDLQGQYVFGDFGSKLFAAVVRNAGGSYSTRVLIQPFSGSSINVASFGEASDGELYALSYFGGTIHRLDFSTGSSGGPVAPALLSDTGCVDPADPSQPASGLVSYSVNAGFWSDGALKERFLALPNGTRFTAAADGDWTAPSRSVFLKTFRLDQRLVETRLLMRQSDGNWAGYSYEWNDAQTNASLVDSGGKSKLIPGTAQTWTYPGRGQCMQCHVGSAGFSLGLETLQMNRSHTYAQTNRSANQLVTLSAPAIDMLSPQVTNPAIMPALPDPFGGASVTARARSYLHTNCAICHRPGTPIPVTMDFRYDTSLAGTQACNVNPSSGSMGVANAKIIAPGDPDRSIVALRMNTRDPSVQMPPLASHVIDAAGVDLIRQWISDLGSCQ